MLPIINSTDAQKDRFHAMIESDDAGNAPSSCHCVETCWACCFAVVGGPLILAQLRYYDIHGIMHDHGHRRLPIVVRHDDAAIEADVKLAELILQNVAQARCIGDGRHMVCVCQQQRDIAPAQLRHWCAPLYHGDVDRQ